MQRSTKLRRSSTDRPAMSSIPRTTTSGPTSLATDDALPPPEAPAAPPPPPGGDGLDNQSRVDDPFRGLWQALGELGDRGTASPPDGHGNLDLQDLLLRRLSDVAAARPITTRPSLGQAEVSKQVEVTRRPMDELARYCPTNNDGKKAVFARLSDADEGLDRAQATLASRQQTLDEARARNRQSPGASDRQSNLAPLEEAVTQAAGAAPPPQAKVASAEVALRSYLKEQSPERAAEIDALDISARREKQTTYTVHVGDQKVTLSDNVKSYATTHKAGLDVKGRSEPVGPIIEASHLGVSAKNILKATSKHEGNFASVNGYDRMGVSFGMIQFAGGAPGSMLSKLLERFKQTDPDGFSRAFGASGIDVTGRPPQLTCLDNEGHQLRGDAAAQFIGSDPRACAALSASGNVLAMKTAQIELSAELLTSQRAHRAPTSNVTVGTVLTSEYGNALLYDRSVNLGPGGTAKAFDKIVNQYLRDHPGADIASDPARAEVEAAFIHWAEQAATTRYPSISASTSHQAGSFVS
jgi:hypothetical protein